MNVVQTTETIAAAAAAAAVAAAEATNKKQQQHVTNFYTETPTFELTLDEFEMYALKRLKVLKKIEQLRNLKVEPKIFESKINKVIEDENLHPESIDVASHFILRLSYCKTEELRNWFCKYECELLRFRLNSSSSYDSNKKQRKKYANVESISQREKEEVQHKLLKLMSITEYTSSTIYCVPFNQVLNLVSTRSCYIRAGMVYVPESKLLDIIMNKFRTELSKDLTLMYQLQNHALYPGSSNNNISLNDPEAVRIYPLINNLDKVLVNREPEYDGNGGLLVGKDGMNRVTAATVPSLLHHMPLCMRVLHRGMEKDRKLKYNGRLQYTLFLKGAGLSLEDAQQFFQRHFTALTAEQFNKEHLYSLRHVYGKEGKRESKSPYSCAKIIMGTPPASGQHHGCPYKHYDDEHLTQLLQQWSIGSTVQERKEIIRYKQNQQYQLACLKHFEYQHPHLHNKNKTNMTNLQLDNVGNHPNAWFRASMDYHYLDSTNDAGMSINSSNDMTTTSFLTQPDSVSSHHNAPSRMEVSP